MADVPVAESGQAFGIQSTAQELGSALGVAVLGTVLLLSTGSALADQLDQAGLTTAEREQIVTTVTDSVGSAIPTITDPDTRAQASTAFTDGTRAAALTGAGILTAGLLTTLSLRRRHPPAARTAPRTAASAPPSSVSTPCAFLTCR